MNNKRRFGFIVVLLVMALATLGCGLGDILPSFSEQNVSTPSGGNMTAIAVTPGKTATQAAIKSTEVLPTAQAGLPSFGNITSNLDKLDSFRSEFSMKMEGVEKATSKPYSGTLNLVMEMIKSKKAKHFVMDGVGLAASSAMDKMEFFEFDQQSYFLMTSTGSKTPVCMSFSTDKPTFDMNALITPDEIMRNIQSGSLLAKGEVVNGVKTDRYKITKMTMGFGTASTESGEVWVAQDGGYVVKSVGQAEGDFSVFSAFKGKINWTYDLKLINQMPAIELPAVCSGAQSGGDVPVPPNAAQRSTLGEIITFSSPDAVKVVADWYLKQAVAQGWAVKTASSLETLVMLTITKDTRSYSVMIAVGTNNQGSSVVISKTK